MLFTSLVSIATNTLNYELRSYNFTITACQRCYLKSEDSGWMFNERIDHIVLQMQLKMTEGEDDFNFFFFFGANKAELL